MNEPSDGSDLVLPFALYGMDGLPLPGSAVEQVLAASDLYAQDRHAGDDTFEVNGEPVRVSTVFLVMDHDFTDGEHVPLLWETALFVGGDMIARTRAQTRDDAVVQHQLMLDEARTGWWQRQDR